MPAVQTHKSPASIIFHLLNWLKQRLAEAQSAPVLMVSGAQGIGKSTAVRTAREILDRDIAVLSIDDVYLTRSERRLLARDVHPLCETRGPPGTHDLVLLNQVFQSLRSASPEQRTRLPLFDKRCDDRAPESQWPVFVGRPDAIVLEGWMLGALPDTGAGTANPINSLEEQEDRDGAWRQWQESHLASNYSALWQRADSFFHIVAPDFDQVLGWRIQQEETTIAIAPGSLPADRRQWVARFVQHFERVTRRMIEGRRMPGVAVCVDAERHVVSTHADGS